VVHAGPGPDGVLDPLPRGCARLAARGWTSWVDSPRRAGFRPPVAPVTTLTTQASSGRSAGGL